MRVIGLLNWYEEIPAWLSATVASAAKLCDHVIAVDGAYAHYPGSLQKPASGPEQAEAIFQAAYGAGIGVTVHIPSEPWWGNEVAKRDFMFRLGEQMTEMGRDWYLIIDADEVLTQVPFDTRKLLEETDLDVAELILWQREKNSDVAHLVETSADYQSPLRRFFRVLPELHVEGAHFVKTAVKDGRKVWLNGASGVHPKEDALALWNVRLENRSHMRDKGRLAAKYAWMRRRDELGLEKVERMNEEVQI